VSEIPFTGPHYLTGIFTVLFLLCTGTLIYSRHREKPDPQYRETLETERKNGRDPLRLYVLGMIITGAVLLFSIWIVARSG